MIPLDSEMGCTTALVIDANNASRSVLANMLREFGVADVAQARRAQDARRLLEQQRFDIVVCDYPRELAEIALEHRRIHWASVRRCCLERGSS